MMDVFSVSGHNLIRAFVVQNAILACMFVWILVFCTYDCGEGHAKTSSVVDCIRLRNQAMLLFSICAICVAGGVVVAIAFRRTPRLDAQSPRRRVIAWVLLSAFSALILWFSIDQVWISCPEALLMLIPYALCISAMMDVSHVSGYNLSRAFVVQNAILACMCVWILVFCTHDCVVGHAPRSCVVDCLRLRNQAMLLFIICAIYVAGGVVFAFQFRIRPYLDAQSPRRRVIAWVGLSAFSAIILWFSIYQLWISCAVALLILIPYAVCICVQIPMYWNLWTY